MKALLLTASVIALIGTAGSASAGIVLSHGQFGGPGVHSTPGELADTVTGTEGSDLVTLSSMHDLLDTSGAAESAFTAHDGSMDDLLIRLTNSYGRVTFSVDSLIPATPSMIISVNGGAFVFHVPPVVSARGSGQTRYTLTANSGSAIHTISFTFERGVDDLRQIRLGNFISATPEPDVWALMLIGFGSLGAMLRWRRAHAAA